MDKAKSSTTPTNEGSSERDLLDVLRVFEEVTGIEALRERDSFVVGFWMKKGFRVFDFRLLIEYHFHSPIERKFLDQPGNMNLRMILNPAREERLLDIWAQLKNAEKIKRRDASSAPERAVMLQTRCGARLSLGDRESYDRHSETCFNKKGTCYF